MALDCSKSAIWQRHCDKNRFRLEWEIVEIAITDLLAAGCRLYYDHDQEQEEETEITACTMAVMEELFACDEETIYVFLPRMNARRWVKFIYGNDGWDVISDYSSSLEPELKRAMEYAEQFS